jgi:DNA-binding beta-propeller fold protein YncE
MVRSTSKRTWIAGAGFLAAVAALASAQAVFEGKAAAEAQGAVQAPRFEVDPFWPKPLPNHWILGSSVGVTVDARDHVFIIHRGAGTLNAETEIGLASNPRTAESCCLAAPPVLEFDPAGNLVGHWGGPGTGYDWPNWNHGIATDDKGNVWIAGGEKKDAQVLKFTAAGKFLMQVGRPGQSRGSNDTENFGRPAKIFVDPKATEAYVAEGYGNKRVAVIDADTGMF